MQERKNIHAVWIRLTPYLIEWAEREYGTGLSIHNHRVLELRPLKGVRELMRMPVDDDMELTIERCNSMSQLRYDVNLHAKELWAHCPADSGGNTSSRQLPTLTHFLPVHCPEYLLMDDGAMRPFSRTIQLRDKTARLIAKHVYTAFWNAVRQYDQSTTHAIDRDMLEDFCEENEIPSIHLDDLRNQYQRMKRHNYFAKKC